MAKIVITFEDSDDGRVLFDFDCPEVNTEADITPAIVFATRMCSLAADAGMLETDDE